MFLKTRWHSHRLQHDVTVARWGVVGQPVLLLPTAGGDAEEIERWQMIDVLGPLLSEGRIKIYSCDSVAGQAWFGRHGSPEYRMWLQNQFHHFVRHEVAPAIWNDCNGELPIWTAGASIGAFHAAALVCRFPDVFTRALSMSGSYDLMRFIESDHPTDDFKRASPLYFVPHIHGRHLEMLRSRHIHIASGGGRWENMEESWNLARVLGGKNIPNWVDPWGPDWHHDWVTWRAMVPKYLGEWTEPS
ncbi:MAG: alpha/beta hydrolase-fold protein [Myxococcota bacterium]